MDRAFIREIGITDWVWRTLQRQLHKRVLCRAHSIVLPTGNRFDLPLCSAFASEVFLTRANVDWGSEALLSRLVRGRGAFLDVGANIGYYSAYMEPLVDAVYAFEPDPHARSHLIANVGPLAKVSVVSSAVGAETSTVWFVQAVRTEVSHIAGLGEEGVEVPLVSIDDFVTQHGLEVAGIKTDIEGHDLQALFGAKALLRLQRPVVLSELQPSRDLLEFARTVDYSIFAYAREPVSRAIRFVQVDAPEALGLVFKMLFLVPEERGDEIWAAA